MGMPVSIVAPCGLVCDLCRGFQRQKNRCPGCTAEGGKPTYCATCAVVRCPEKGGDPVKPCSACPKYPCRRLKALEKRYTTNYGESLLENFRRIGEVGTDRFLLEADEAWRCPECGELLCAHRPKCPRCEAPNVHYKRETPRSAGRGAQA
ncbi:MAG: DUF3795 domain-containing protein [Clostridiales bacterium]|jgi:hypothetical protein|nr:DUF3795 domain-containing protein [Clostridiales bacterium]